MAAHLSSPPSSISFISFFLNLIRFLPSIILNATLLGLTLFAIANPATLAAISSPLALSLLPISPTLLLTSLFITYSYLLQINLFHAIANALNVNSSPLTFITLRLLAIIFPLPVVLGLFSFAPTTVAVLYLPALTLIVAPHIRLLRGQGTKLRMLNSFLSYIHTLLLAALLIAFAPTLAPVIVIPLIFRAYYDMYGNPQRNSEKSSNIKKLLFSTLHLSTSFTYTFIACVLIASLAPLLTPTLPILAPLLPLITGSSSFVAQFNPLIFAATFTLIQETLNLLINSKYRDGSIRYQLGINQRSSTLYLFFTSLQSLTQTTVHSLYTHKMDPELTEAFTRGKSASDESDTLGSDTSTNQWRAGAERFFEGGAPKQNNSNKDAKPD